MIAASGLPAAASGQGVYDDGEGVCAVEPCGVDGRPHVRFGFGGPHGAVAVRHLSLDHTRAELALGGVVGDVDLAGVIAEGQELVSCAPDFGLQVSGEIASGRSGQKGLEPLFQFPLFSRQRRGGEIADGPCEVERLCQPELEAERQIVRAVLEREGDVAGQMRQTRLMPIAMILLSRITI